MIQKRFSTTMKLNTKMIIGAQRLVDRQNSTDAFLPYRRMDGSFKAQEFVCCAAGKVCYAVVVFPVVYSLFNLKRRMRPTVKPAFSLLRSDDSKCDHNFISCKRNFCSISSSFVLSLSSTSSAGAAAGGQTSEGFQSKSAQCILVK